MVNSDSSYSSLTDDHRPTRGGYEEPPDHFKIKDGKDNTVFCFRCQGSSLPIRQSDDIPAVGRGGREIIQCDHCNLSWHLECLDPPLAVAPKKIKTGPNRPKTTWMCPNHIDPELNSIDPQANLSNRDRPTFSRKYKVRRPKDSITVDSNLNRGFKNNGLFEIQNESSDDDTWTPTSTAVQILRVPERGVKLDFIDRVKR